MPANEVLYPEEVNEFLSFLNEYAEDVIKAKRDEIEDDLSSATKLDDVKEKEKEIDGTLTDIVAEDNGMKLIVSKLTEVRNELRELNVGDE